LKDALRELATDFLSAIVFFVLYLITGNAILGTSVAILVAIAQVAHAHIKGRPLGFMAYASLGLVIVLGTVTLLTHDPRFMFAKPAIAHFAIGVIMLKRGWMLRYVPPIVTDTIPGAVTVAGYAWAVLMFALGLGTIAVAFTGDLKLWAFYISFVAIGAKLVAFAIQYVSFRLLVRHHIRTAAPDRRDGLMSKHGLYGSANDVSARGSMLRRATPGA
jgi:intracellular septation protein